QAAERLIQGSQQVVDVFLGSLHGGQAARVFGCQRFGASLVQRDKKILPDECLQRPLMVTDDLGQVFGRPGKMGQLDLPFFIQRQQVLTDRFISRPGLGAVVEEVKLTKFSLAVMRFTFNQDLTDERRDGVDGSRNGEKSHRRDTGIRQPRSNAIADGPDFLFAGQRIERLGDKIRQYIVELADKSLIGAEDDGAYRLRSRAGLPGLLSGDVLIPQAHRQAEFHGAIIVRQRQNGLLILSDARGGHGLHRADHGFQITGSADLAAQARQCIAHGFFLGSGSGFGWKGAIALPTTCRIALRSSSLNLSFEGKRLRISAGMSAAAFLRASSASRILSIGTLSRTPPVNATRMTICSGTVAGSSSGWMRMARIRWPWSMILRVLSSRRVPNLAKDSSSLNCAYASLRSPATAR